MEALELVFNQLCMRILCNINVMWKVKAVKCELLDLK